MESALQRISAEFIFMEAGCLLIRSCSLKMKRFFYQFQHYKFDFDSLDSKINENSFLTK